MIRPSGCEHKMGKCFVALIILFLPVQVLALTGVVSKVDVCRNGNVIFKTASGWYVTARYLSGQPLKEGDKVSGKLKTFGIQIISSKTNGRKGKYYILDFEVSRLDAINAHCGRGVPK